MTRFGADSENVKIDKKDQKIMTALAENSRITLSKLSKEVQLSRDAVDYRIKRLKEKGVIKNFQPIISYSKLGFYKYRVFFLVDEEKEARKQAFIKDLKENQRVTSIVHYHDKWDYSVTILARNIREFDKILREIVGKYENIVMEKDNLAIIGEYSYLTLPTKNKKLHKVQKIEDNKEEEVDEKDVEILRLLFEDARKSSYEIGKSVKLSSDAVLYRIKKLQNSGVIKGFTTIFDLKKLDYSLYSLGIMLRKLDDKTEAKIKEFIKTQGNILTTMKSLGTWDLLLYVAVKEPNEFHYVMKDIKKTFADIIKNYDVWIAYEEIYFNAFPDFWK